MKELWFIEIAGTDAFEKGVDDIPSWAPNFPGVCQKSYPNFGSPGQLAYRSVFPDDGERAASVVDLSLFVEGIVLDTIIQVNTWEAVVKAEGIINYMQDHMSRFPRYPANMLTLQAFFKVFLRSWQVDHAVGRDIILARSKLAFLRYVLEFQRFESTRRIDGGPYHNELSKLGIDSSSGKRFAESFRRAIYPGLGDDKISWLSDRLPAIVDEYSEEWEDSELGAMLKLISWELPRMDRASMARTSAGYFALVPKRGTLVGDQICVLRGSYLPSIIRPKSDYYEHVRSCYCVGLSNGEARRFVEQGISKIQRLELR
ncbi:hypothetical protein BX600DRAFT_442096 [Xylariales sp. PMI_506]|nr:hypothetical protein BX600DRAFT_442096 [Xylariales sp. PMI_506]